jgi:hypothetical protein
LIFKVGKESVIMVLYAQVSQKNKREMGHLYQPEVPAIDLELTIPSTLLVLWKLLPLLHLFHTIALGGNSGFCFPDTGSASTVKVTWSLN